MRGVRPQMNWLKRIVGRRAKVDHMPSTVPEDRRLTPAETEFIRWMLAHGNDRSREFLWQLDRAMVVGRCGCGCASINLSISGVTHAPKGGMETLCEYRWAAAEGEFEVFAFACGNLLAGIDLWAVWGENPASYLPFTALLKPGPSGNAA
jgi:hypothetical protein